MLKRALAQRAKIAARRLCWIGLFTVLGCASARFSADAVQPPPGDLTDAVSPVAETLVPDIGGAPDADTDSPLSLTDVAAVVAPLQDRSESIDCPPGGQGTDPQFLNFGNVTLEGVVVIGVAHYAGTGWERFHVADRAGGPWSGIAVDMPKGTLTVAEGELLTISGELQEYYCLTRVKITAATQVIRAGTAAQPQPLTITCAQLSDKAQAEALEGVLVQVSDVTVASHGEFGQLTLDAGCVVDDDFKPSGSARPAVGSPFSAIIGIVSYGFGVYTLLPRSSADLVAK